MSGLQFVRQLLAKDNKVVAAVRSRSKELEELQQKHQSKLLVSSLDVSSPQSIEAWAKELSEGLRLGHIDVSRSCRWDSRHPHAAAPHEMPYERGLTLCLFPCTASQYVINNAGIYDQGGSLDSITAESMIRTFQTNTIGPLLVVQQLRRRRLIGGGKPTVIANVTSKVG